MACEKLTGLPFLSASDPHQEDVRALRPPRGHAEALHTARGGVAGPSGQAQGARRAEKRGQDLKSSVVRWHAKGLRANRFCPSLPHFSGQVGGVGTVHFRTGHGRVHTHASNMSQTLPICIKRYRIVSRGTNLYQEVPIRIKRYLFVSRGAD
eukprot:966178-Prorocentrum_minimum.AAC.1